MPEICLKYRLSSSGIGRQKLPSYTLTGEYFAEHAEDIFNVTPETLQAYLDSEKGQQRMREIQNYMKLREASRKYPYWLPVYGAKMFMLAYGRSMLWKRIQRMLQKDE